MEKPKKPPRLYIDKEFPETSSEELWFTPSPPFFSFYQNVKIKKVEKIKKEERVKLFLKQRKKRKGAPSILKKQKRNQEPNIRVIKPKPLPKSTNVMEPCK